MFIWFSQNNGRSRWGCCGGFLILPLGLLTLFSGFDNRLLVLLVIGLVLAAVFVLPQLRETQADGEKAKNDSDGEALFGDEKPKRRPTDAYDNSEIV